MLRIQFSLTLALLLLLSPFCVSAGVIISEIMYDLPSGDTDREWIEIHNSGTSAVDLSTYKFFEDGINHGIATTTANQSFTLQPNGYAIIVDSLAKFILDWPQFSGAIFDSSFSLSNTGESLAIKNGTEVVDQVTYSSSIGANGDGNTLQKVDGVWKALSPTLGSSSGGSQSTPNSGAPQTQVPTVSGNTTSQNTTSDSSTSSGENRSSWPVEPQIFSKIEGPQIVVVGADSMFKGGALGLNKEPLSNARFLWNFGDGVTKEGESVLHAYNFPSEYIVVLEASSGKYVAESRLKIKVIPADVIVGAVVGGVDGKVELVNNAPQEIDLSWWRIGSGGKFFTLPKNTKILSHARLPLSATVLGFPVDDSDVSLLYPNGSLVHRFEKQENPKLAVAPVTVPPKEVEKSSVLTSSVSEDLPVKKEVVVEAKPFLQKASVVDAIENDLETKEEVQVQNDQKSFVWPYALGGVIVLGAAAVFMKKPSMPKSPEEEKIDITIIED